MAMDAGRYYEQRQLCLAEGCYAVHAEGIEHLGEISWELRACGQASSGRMAGGGGEVRICIGNEGATCDVLVAPLNAATRPATAPPALPAAVALPAARSVAASTALTTTVALPGFSARRPR